MKAPFLRYESAVSWVLIDSDISVTDTGISVIDTGTLIVELFDL